MKAQAFLNNKTVFNLQEFADFYSHEYSGHETGRRSLVKYYLRTGRLKQVRKGLYLSSPPGKPSVADPYLICAKMAADSVIAYHTALQFHGKVYSIRNDYLFYSRTRIHPFEYDGQVFKSVLFPRPLLDSRQEMFGVQTVESQGEPLLVTSLERSLVDVLQRPDLGGGWEEIWRSLEMIEYFDLDQIVQYVELLGNSTTAAKVGFFLEQHCEQLMISQNDLHQLRLLKPESPHYMDRTLHGDTKFLSDWNLVVPDSIANRRWEEQ